MIVIAYNQSGKWVNDKTEPETFCGMDCDTLLVPDGTSDAEITERVRQRIDGHNRNTGNT